MAHKDMEPELECFDAQTRKSEGFGELKGGFMVRCSLRMCRQYVLCYAIIYIFPVLFVSTIRLLDSKHFLLPLLGARFPLEVAVGMNGRVWINAKEIKQTIAMARCIEAVDPDGGGMGEAGMKALLETLDV
jgi:exosome complex component RRP40